MRVEGVREKKINRVGPVADRTERADSMLVARAREGDVPAFAALYLRYHVRVYDFAAHRLESREAAEDATQTIFLRALLSIGQCRDEHRFAGWLFAIARNVVIDTYRRRTAVVQAVQELPDVPDPAETAESLAIRLEEEREMRTICQQCLSPVELDVLDLRLQGLADRDIAIALGKSYGTVRNIQYQLVRKLRSAITAETTVNGTETPQSDAI